MKTTLNLNHSIFHIINNLRDKEIEITEKERRIIEEKIFDVNYNNKKSLTEKAILKCLVDHN